MRDDLALIVGETPGLVAGTSTYYNSTMAAWIYAIERRGIGTLVKDQDYSVVPTGGFSLLKTGDVFGTDEVFTVRFISPDYNLNVGNETISNGFNASAILEKLFGRVGWRQPSVDGSPTLNAANTTSRSGRYYQDFHPLVTVQNILDTVEGGEGMDDAQVNAFLMSMQQSVILRTINGVFNKPQLIESTLLFDRKLRNDIPTTNYGKFCGYRLMIGPGEFALQVSRVSFLFNANATFTLYLYQDAIIAPLYQKEVTVTAYNEAYIDLDDWIVNYVSSKSMGGVFYIGYYQDEINAQGAVALDEFVTQWNRSYAFGYTAMEAVADFANKTFVRIAVPYTLRTYGMNMEVQTYYDFTNKIIKNASLFDEAIGLTMAIEALGYMAYSARSNKTQRITQEMGSIIYNEIMNSGDALQLNPYVAGLKQQLTQEIGRLNRNFFRDDRIVEIKTTRPPIYGVR